MKGRQNYSKICGNKPRYSKICGNPAELRRPRYNEQHMKAGKNYSKICGNKPRYNEDPVITNNI